VEAIVAVFELQRAGVAAQGQPDVVDSHDEVVELGVREGVPIDDLDPAA
jgi:hypothetical protein